MADVDIAIAAADAGWNASELPIAVAIAFAESNGNPTAVGGPNSNGTRDWGAWQINDVHNPSSAEKTQLGPNAAKAYSIFKDAGNKFTPWSTFNSGAYKAQLPRATAAVKQVDAILKGLKPITPENKPLSLNPLDGMTNPLTNPLNSAITKPLQDIGNRLFDFFNISLGVLLGIVLLLLGVVILARGFAGRVVAGTVSDMAKQAKAAEKAAPKPAKAPPLTPEQRARNALDYSAARKRLAAADAKEAADAARERLRRSMGQ